MRTRQQVLGQNFLHHKPTIEKIVDLIETELSRSPSRALLEIGPGKLALTHGLTEVAQKRSLPLILVERDRYLEETIRQGAPHAHIHFMDAATEKFSNLLSELGQSNQTPVFVASNLPYSASSQILAQLCRRSTLVSGAVVMVQKEMARRMAAAAATPDRGAFSLLIQSYFDVKLAFDVGPGAFSPPPKVTSTIVVMRPLESRLIAQLEEPLKFEQFCKMLFSQRRKMIRNLIPPEHHDVFAKEGMSGTERPEVLELKTVIRLYQRAVEGEKE